MRRCSVRAREAVQMPLMAEVLRDRQLAVEAGVLKHDADQRGGRIGLGDHVAAADAAPAPRSDAWS